MFFSVWIAQVWVRQNMPETLVLFLVALFVFGLYVVLSRCELTSVLAGNGGGAKYVIGSAG